MPAPEQMDAKIDPTTRRINAPANGFTDDVMNKTLFIKQEMDRFASPGEPKKYYGRSRRKLKAL